MNDNAAGIRGAISRLEGLNDHGEPKDWPPGWLQEQVEKAARSLDGLDPLVRASLSCTPPAPPPQADRPAVAEQGYTSGPPLPEHCECDKFLHAPGQGRCEREPADHGSVRSSPALCDLCLNYCYNDDEEW